MFKTLVLAISLVAWIKCFEIDLEDKLKPLSQKIIDYVNNHPESTWKAAHSNHFKTLIDALIRLGVKSEPEHVKRKHPVTKAHTSLVDLPESFDAREQWPDCPTIGQIRDQSNCGSCWAFAAAEAMSDRICIHSNATIKVQLSARHLLSCCSNCGDGCCGGTPIAAWQYWVTHGVVTGGSLENPTGCQPYPFPSCEHHTTGDKPTCKEIYETPECLKECTTGYNATLDGDKYYGSEAYTIHPTERDIMEDLLINGPQEVVLKAYGDFLTYKSGIYKHLAGGYLGSHAVKLLGWGIENGTKYWLLANSWNEDWGESGFFRIVRGVNESNIESEATAGLPRFT